jgi:hypothetical protein
VRRRIPEVAFFSALIVGAGACQIDAEEGSATAGETGDTPGPEAGPAATIEWVYSADSCGDAFGVVHRGDDAIVVGNLDGAPWVIRLAHDGTPLWTYTDEGVYGAFFAVDVGVDPAADAPLVWAAGRYEVDGGERYGLLTGLGDDGVVDLEIEGLGGPGVGFFAVAGDDGGGLPVVAGIRDDFDMLVGRVDPVEGSLDAWVAPAGQGGTSSVGFGLRAAAGEGVVTCGRASLGEGGTSWLGRYDLDGGLAWDVEGPTPPVGAAMDCWALAPLADGGAAVVDRGYLGARVAAYDGAGALLWEHTEANTGAQAVDVGGGQIFVGGWSADPEAEPLRSHGTGAFAGWIIALSEAGDFLWHAELVDALSLYAIRYHADGWLTAVGTRDPLGTCPKPWIARLRLQ